MRDFAGDNAMDCGRVRVHADPNTTTDCVLKAAAEKRPFFARYDVMGIDSEVSGAIAGDAKGKVYSMQYDSMGWIRDGLPDPPKAFYLDGGHVIALPCPSPLKLKRSKSGRVTCFEPTKARHNIMSPNAEGW
jgi:hypothetical protein